MVDGSVGTSSSQSAVIIIERAPRFPTTLVLAILFVFIVVLLILLYRKRKKNESKNNDRITSTGSPKRIFVSVE